MALRKNISNIIAPEGWEVTFLWVWPCIFLYDIFEFLILSQLPKGGNFFPKMCNFLINQGMWSNIS